MSSPCFGLGSVGNGAVSSSASLQRIGGDAASASSGVSLRSQQWRHRLSANPEITRLPSVAAPPSGPTFGLLAESEIPSCFDPELEIKNLETEHRNRSVDVFLKRSTALLGLVGGTAAVYGAATEAYGIAGVLATGLTSFGVFVVLLTLIFAVYQCERYAAANSLARQILALPEFSQRSPFKAYASLHDRMTKFVGTEPSTVEFRYALLFECKWQIGRLIDNEPPNYFITGAVGLYRDAALKKNLAAQRRLTMISNCGYLNEDLQAKATEAVRQVEEKRGPAECLC